MHLYGSSSNVPRLQIVFGNAKILHFLLTFFKVHTIPCACHEKDIWTSKSAPYSTRQFFALWLRNSLRDTTACNFSTFQLPTVAPRIVCFAHFDFEICSRHNGNFFISHLARWLRTLASLLFNPPEPQIIGETQCFAISTFSCTCTFFPLTLSLLSSSFFFSSLTLPTSAFPSAHVVGSLTSKLPSIDIK